MTNAVNNAIIVWLMSVFAGPAFAEEDDYARTRYPIVISPSGGAFTQARRRSVHARRPQSFRDLVQCPAPLISMRAFRRRCRPRRVARAITMSDGCLIIFW
jgi:hypothetical protein